jgi:hypothetical protein
MVLTVGFLSSLLSRRKKKLRIAAYPLTIFTILTHSFLVEINKELSGFVCYYFWISCSSPFLTRGFKKKKKNRLFSFELSGKVIGMALLQF